MRVSEKDQKHNDIWKILTDKKNSRQKPTSFMASEDDIPNAMVGKPLERGHLEGQSLYESIILKCILRKWSGKDVGGRWWDLVNAVMNLRVL
jgi:hypothetical protein